MENQVEIIDERAGLASASSFAMDVNCPGRRNLLRSMPPPEQQGESSEVADRGSRIHKARETGSTLELQDDGEVEAYQQGLRNEKIFIEQWQQEFGIAEFDEYTEMRLWLYERCSFEPLASGRLDVIFVERNSRSPHVLFTDWKSMSGLSAGRADSNWQIKLQAILAAFEFNACHCRGVLNKPEAWGQQIDAVDFDQQALQNIEYMVRWHIWFSSLPDAPRRAGPWCTWCPCAAYCPERAAQALIPTAITNGVLERIDTLSPRDLRKLWDSSTLITKMLARVDYRLANLPPEDLASVGLYLGKPKETDKFADVPSAVARLKERGLSEADILTCAKLGKGELVKLIRREFGLSSDVKAEAWIERNLSEFIETSEGARALKEIKA